MDEWMAALEEEGVQLNEESREKLSAYGQMLVSWNEKMDLTSVSYQDTAARHFADSLLPLKIEGLFPVGCRIVDVGSGAGFPGLPLAIARPDMRVTLLEAQGKRCQFLRAVKEELALENVFVVQERAEIAGQQAEHRETYDRACARAVAPLNLLCEYLLPFVKVGGAAVCWKGPAVSEEMADGAAAAAALGGTLSDLIGMAWEETKHNLVLIQKIEKTLPQFPRKNGIPAKRPIKCGKK